MTANQTAGNQRFTPEEVRTYYADRVPNVNQQQSQEWRGPCPIHHGQDDNFAVDPHGGRWFCHSQCGRGGGMVKLEMALSGTDFKTAKAAVYRIIGRLWRRVVYVYRDESETPLFRVIRLECGQGAQRKKKFFQQHNNDGRWANGLAGVRRVPYQLPEVLKAKRVYIVEGEKDVKTLIRWGLVATTNPMGAGKWVPEFACFFKGKHVVIVPDNDAPGRTHAADVAGSLLGVAASVRVVELPGLPEKGDVTDWANDGGTSAELKRLRRAAKHLDAPALAELRERWGQPNRDIPGEWPDPLAIQAKLPPVEAFHTDLLPVSLRPMVKDIAERMQVPIDLPAIAMVLCLAGAVSRRAVIQPKALDSGWVIVPNLWGGIIALPGFLKSPVIQNATRPLNEVQAEWRREHEDALKDYALAKETQELKHTAWKQHFKENLKKGAPAPPRPGGEPEEPILRRLIVNDATFEATHKTMSENPAGILVIRDELTGWLSRLDQEEFGTERAFALQAWNGDAPYIMDRIGRGTISAPACCMSMLGGIQPGRLRSYLVDALKDGPANDGLMQRFQFLVWPDTPSGWNYVDRAPDAASEAQAETVLRKLVELKAENPLRFRYASDAQELFVKWLADLELKVRGAELHPALTSHLSKYRSLMPSLALLFELADQAGSDGFEGSFQVGAQNFVSLEHTKQAIAWCKYLASHARRIYSCVVTPQMGAAQALAEKIKHRKVGANGSFSCRDVYLKGCTGLDTPALVSMAADVLEDAGWLRRAHAGTGPQGGRPSYLYDVNPKVWQ